MYLPALYSAWQWHPGPGTPPTTGSCTPCDGKQGSFSCAYIFPCFSDEPGLHNWGHRDTSVGGVPRVSFVVTGCNTHLPNGSSSMANSNFWLPGKGPKWQGFGWQLSQQGAQPDTRMLKTRGVSSFND